MTARAMWKGVIAFGSHEVPVKWYAAAQDHGISFRMLDEKTTRPVSQKMVDPTSGDPVPSEAVRRGYELEPGVFVLLTKEELSELDPESDRAIDVVAFVDPETLTSPWYDRPYWLAPDGDEEAYYALSRALSEKNAVGIARWTMRKRRYVGALRAEGPYLMMSTLRHLGEVVPIEAVEAPRVKVDDKEAKLAAQLVDALADELDLTEYRDEYTDRVAQLVEDKAKGKKVTAKKKPRKKKETVSLADSLRKSIDAAKKGKKGRKVA